MTLAEVQPVPPVSKGEERFVLHGVPWHVYVALRDSLDDEGSHVRLTYLEGALELMSPSPLHEVAGSILGRLVEEWCDLRDVDLFPLRSTTLRSETKRRGLEADESYAVGTSKTVPDIAIEVVVSSGVIDKLDVYAGLGVREVWVWKDGLVTVRELVDGAYRVVSRSSVLPALDVEHLASFVRPGESLTRIVRAYRASLAGR